MKKAALLLSMLLVLQTQISAQTTEGYITNNLGRIVEAANSGGTLSEPHLLIGYDTTGFVIKSSSANIFKIFATAPNTTNMQTLNIQNRFGAPGTNDCYEIHFGSDSSRYWINSAFTSGGGSLAHNQLPFSVFYVGPKSSYDTTITGGIKLCIKITDQDGDSLYSPGEMIHVCADLALPLDSVYDSLSHRGANPFVSSNGVLTRVRFGQSSIPNTQTTFAVPGDGIIPPQGTVIRFVAKTADNIPPIVSIPDTVYRGYSQEFIDTVNIYPPVPTGFSLLQAPEGMTIDSQGVIRWSIADNQAGNEYAVVVHAENAYGSSNNSFRIVHSPLRPGINEFEINIPGHNLHFYGLNDGAFPGRPYQTRTGLYYKSEGGETELVYAGGLYIGGQKQGTPDTIVVSDVEFSSEYQPGRILNQGPFGLLIAEDYTVNPTFFVLPDDYMSWPLEAPHDSLGNPLKLSAKDTWNVFNDIDSARNTPNQHSLAPRMGLEVQRQTFMFQQYPFNNALLFRTRIINKSDAIYDSCYVGLWMDPDVGYNATQDLSGSDSTLSMVYTYSNPVTTDLANTAFGCLLLKGPVVNSASDTARFVDINHYGLYHKELPGKKVLMASSAKAFWGSSGDDPGHVNAFDDKTRYWYMQGYDVLGNPKPGGPFDVQGGNNPADQRVILGCGGTFTFTAGDTQDVWYAYIGAKGVSNPSAVDTLFNYANLIRNKFYGNVNSLVGIEIRNDINLKQFVLYPNYPNPFNPSTTIRYEINHPSKVTLKIYNLLGQEVRTLVNKHQSNGIHSAVWDGKNDRGQMVGSGVYFYRLQAGDFVKTRKMVLVK